MESDQLFPDVERELYLCNDHEWEGAGVITKILAVISAMPLRSKQRQKSTGGTGEETDEDVASKGTGLIHSRSFVKDYSVNVSVEPSLCGYWPTIIKARFNLSEM